MRAPLSAVFVLLTASLAAALAACDAPPGGPEVVTWRFAIEETSGSVQDAYAQRFKQLVEERSGGRIRVIVYPYGALGTSDHILEQLHNGTLDFAMASPGHLGKLIPEIQVFLLHFMLSEDEAVNACALSDPALRGEVERLYAEKGLRFIDVFSEGFMVWTTQKAVREPADFDGMKFRVMTSPLLIAAYAAYGASPTPLPYSEVYSGLQLHMIDGQVNPVFAIEEMGFYEVTNWMVFPRAVPFVTTVAGSPELFAGLPPGERRLVDGVISELHGYIDEVQRRYNAERLDVIERKKPELELLRLDRAQRAVFRDAARPARERFVELTAPRGPQILATLEAAVARATQRCGG